MICEVLVPACVFIGIIVFDLWDKNIEWPCLLHVLQEADIDKSYSWSVGQVQLACALYTGSLGKQENVQVSTEHS